MSDAEKSDFLIMKEMCDRNLDITCSPPCNMKRGHFTKKEFGEIVFAVHRDAVQKVLTNESTVVMYIVNKKQFQEIKENKSHQPLNLPKNRQNRIEKSSVIDDGAISAGQPDELKKLYIKEVAERNSEIIKLTNLLNEIEKIACGEEQIEADGVYDDSDGMKWIYDRIQKYKRGE